MEKLNSISFADELVSHRIIKDLFLKQIDQLLMWTKIEEQVKDRISFSHFVGIPLNGDVPDHGVISRFRTILTSKGTYEEFLTEINQRLTIHIESVISILFQHCADIANLEFNRSDQG